MTGGLAGLQSALVATAVPLAVLMLVMCYSTYKGLQDELRLTSGKKSKEKIRKEIKTPDKRAL
ncbi:BCCT family transporter [Rossellomorea sp. BNER]|uniref:BCCT family transporter n=1 Tax=Rossellomorea sp. BNER TaxID=2962031 RepID=UPI003AF2FF43|nr:BCCT family transporter [Rossellomorea sp. BNER]